MTAVAVWDHRPHAGELLKRRVDRGWRPTPSALRSGDAVLGYAACLASGGLPSEAGAEEMDPRIGGGP